VFATGGGSLQEEEVLRAQGRLGSFCYRGGARRLGGWELPIRPSPEGWAWAAGWLQGGKVLPMVSPTTRHGPGLGPSPHLGECFFCLPEFLELMLTPFGPSSCRRKGEIGVGRLQGPHLDAAFRAVSSTLSIKVSGACLSTIRGSCGCNLGFFLVTSPP
jgi:hypothetical protein